MDVEKGNLTASCRSDELNRHETRPDTRAKTVRLALLILRSLPKSVTPILSSFHLTVDEYDSE